MKWQPIAGEGGGCPRVPWSRYCAGSPEQKYGVRLIGATACIWVASRPLNQSALARSISAIFGIEIEAKQPLGQRSSRATQRSARPRNVRKRLFVLVHLADDARPHVVAPVEQFLF